MTSQLDDLYQEIEEEKKLKEHYRNEWAKEYENNLKIQKDIDFLIDGLQKISLKIKSL